MICTDIAMHPNPSQLSAVGTSAVAMLIGSHAHLVLEENRVSFVKHAWDFYRPIGWHNNDTVIDLDQDTDQYEEALRFCTEQYVAKCGGVNLLSVYDFVAFHCNAPYHAKRSLRLMSNMMFGRDLSRHEHDELFERHVEAGTAISAQKRNNIYMSFVHMLAFACAQKKEDMIGKRVLCFSYGSGCAASLFAFRVREVALHPADILARLKQRTHTPVHEAIQIIQSFEDTYGNFGFEPSTSIAKRQDKAFYLSSVSPQGVRKYLVHHRNKALRVTKHSNSLVTTIEFLQEVIDEEFIQEMLSALDVGRVHVMTSACEKLQYWWIIWRYY